MPDLLGIFAIWLAGKTTTKSPGRSGLFAIFKKSFEKGLTAPPAYVIMIVPKGQKGRFEYEKDIYDSDSIGDFVWLVYV